MPSDSRWTRRITGLTIADLRVEDSGNYICEVTNSFGSKEVTGHLNVIGGLKKKKKSDGDGQRGDGLVGEMEGKMVNKVDTGHFIQGAHHCMGHSPR